MLMDTLWLNRGADGNDGVREMIEQKRRIAMLKTKKDGETKFHHPLFIDFYLKYSLFWITPSLMVLERE